MVKVCWNFFSVKITFVNYFLFFVALFYSLQHNKKHVYLFYSAMHSTSLIKNKKEVDSIFLFHTNEMFASNVNNEKRGFCISLVHRFYQPNNLVLDTLSRQFLLHILINLCILKGKKRICALFVLVPDEDLVCLVFKNWIPRLREKENNVWLFIFLLANCVS